MRADEQTGWRDPYLSMLHREWGIECPAVDVDLVEYDKGKPVAVCDYKLEVDYAAIDRNHANFCCQRDLAGAVPFFIVIYSRDYDYFEVSPENQPAKVKLPRRTAFNSLEDFVEFLYGLRNKPLPNEIRDRIRNTNFDDLVLKRLEGLSAEIQEMRRRFRRRRRSLPDAVLLEALEKADDNLDEAVNRLRKLRRADAQP